MAIVGTDFKAVFDKSKNTHVNSTLAHIYLPKNKEWEEGVMVYQCPKQT